MHAALLLGTIITSAAPTELRHLADRNTLTVALNRSDYVATQLLDAMPEHVQNSPRARIQSILADIRRDQTRLTKESKSPLFEAGVFVHYSELVALANKYLGSDQLEFRPIRAVTGEVRIANGNGNGHGNSHNGKVAYSTTLFTHDDLLAIGEKTHQLLEQLAAKDKIDPYHSAKWKKDVAAIRDNLKRVQEEMRLRNLPSMIPSEAKLLGLYAQAVSLTVNEGK
jgi:hypothetical protein